MFEHTEGYQSYYVLYRTNKYRSTFYVGMTNDLPKRLSVSMVENIKNE